MKRLRYLLRLAGQSAWNRKGTLTLVVFSIALSTTLLLGIERVRAQARDSFVQAISGTDLVVGARGSSLQLMLYAVFHLGGAASNMGWDSARRIAARKDVSWTVPLSLGDSYRGFPVVGTSTDFFSHYLHSRDKRLRFAQGGPFEGVFDVVLGAEAAKKARHALGDKLVLSHGSRDSRLAEHADKPFAVCGILAPTGTPVDRGLYISLGGMEAIHIDWQGGAPLPGFQVRADQVTKFNLTPKNITALLVGLKSRARVFAVQREINADPDEALMGVMPGVAMDQLWGMLHTAESALRLISWLVTLAGLAGLVSAILAGLNERRRELAILRSAGASPADIITLLSLEGMLLVLAGALTGLAALTGLTVLEGPLLAEHYGLGIVPGWPGQGEWLLLGGILCAGFPASLIPAWRAYRMSLTDGLSASV